MIHEQCIHRWNIDRHNVGTCSHCGEIRQFPWNKGEVIVLKKGKHTEIPEKEDNMKTSIRERHAYYEEHKDEIIADLLSIGRTATRKKWNIPLGGSIEGLMKRWLTTEQIASMASTRGRPTTPASDNPTPPPDPRIGVGPKFPEFNDTWGDIVQVKWLEVFVELIKERKE